MADYDDNSEVVVDLLVKHDNISREEASELWFGSKTYAEIIRRGWTFMPPTCAYSELKMELDNDSDWMRDVWV